LKFPYPHIETPRLSQNKPKPLPRRLARDALPKRNRPLDNLSPIEFLVQSYQNEAEECGGADGDEGGYTVDAHSDDYEGGCISNMREFLGKAGGRTKAG